MFSAFLESFTEHRCLQARVEHVLCALPEEIQQDFLDDTTFRVTLEDYTPENGWRMFMECPSPATRMSRCVVLRSRLDSADESFALYIIAHEFAHAFLRNGGWGEISDAEDAADALADHWGFPKPRR